MSSGSAVAMTSAPASVRSLGGSSGADADCGLHRRHLEDGTCAGSVVRGWEVWFPPSTSESWWGVGSEVRWRARGVASV